MTLINLPRTNQTGPNEWEDVEANDRAIANVVNGQLTDENIRDGADISGLKLADGTIPTAKLTDQAVTNPKLADNSVSTAKVQDSAITTAKLADNSVTSAKLDLDTVEYTENHTVTTDVQIVISEEPTPGTYLAFAGAWTISTNPSAGGFIRLTKNDSVVASSFVAGDANRSAAIRPAKVEIGEGDTIGVLFENANFATGWTLNTYLTLLRIG